MITICYNNNINILLYFSYINIFYSKNRLNFMHKVQTNNVLMATYYEIIHMFILNYKLVYNVIL